MLPGIELNPAEMLYCLGDGMKLLDKRIHGMFTIVELLCTQEDFGGVLPGDDNNAVLIGNDDVVCVDFDAVAIHGDIDAAEAIVADGCGRNGAGGIDRKSDALELWDIADPSVDYSTGEAA